MVNGLIGIKKGMTQVFDDEDRAVGVTLVKAGPCMVVQVKTPERDGYRAVQLGLVSEGKVKNLTKPMKGHFDRSGVPPMKVLKEFELENGEELGEIEPSDRYTVDLFEDVEKVDVTGTSKGKGFQGVVKRWGFSGGRSSHGSRHYRTPGSIGQAADPSRIFKGKKMPGRMGGDQVTIKNLEIMDIREEDNILALKGSVPGKKEGYVFVRKADY